MYTVALLGDSWDDEGGPESERRERFSASLGGGSLTSWTCWTEGQLVTDGGGESDDEAKSVGSKA